MTATTTKENFNNHAMEVVEMDLHFLEVVREIEEAALLGASIFSQEKKGGSSGRVVVDSPATRAKESVEMSSHLDSPLITQLFPATPCSSFDPTEQVSVIYVSPNRPSSASQHWANAERCWHGAAAQRGMAMPLQLVEQRLVAHLVTFMDDLALRRFESTCHLFHLLILESGEWRARFQRLRHKAFHHDGFAWEVYTKWSAMFNPPNCALPAKQQYDKLKLLSQQLALLRTNPGNASRIRKPLQPISQLADLAHKHQSKPKQVAMTHKLLNLPLRQPHILKAPSQKELLQVHKCYIQDFAANLPVYMHECIGPIFPFFLQFHIRAPDLPSHAFYLALVQLVVPLIHEATLGQCGKYAAVCRSDASWVDAKIRDKFASGMRFFWPDMKVLQEQACKLRIYVALNVEQTFKDDLARGWEIEISDKVYREGLSMIGSFTTTTCPMCEGRTWIIQPTTTCLICIGLGFMHQPQHQYRIWKVVDIVGNVLRTTKQHLRLHWQLQTFSLRPGGISYERARELVLNSKVNKVVMQESQRRTALQQALTINTTKQDVDKPKRKKRRKRKKRKCMVNENTTT